MIRILPIIAVLVLAGCSDNTGDLMMKIAKECPVGATMTMTVGKEPWGTVGSVSCSQEVTE